MPDHVLLSYTGFGQSTGIAHVILFDAMRTTIFAGQPEDNPGTSVTNAIELVATAIRNKLTPGEAPWRLYQFHRHGIPNLDSTVDRVDFEDWTSFEFPHWTRVDPRLEFEMAAQDLRDTLRRLETEGDYTVSDIRERFQPREVRWSRLGLGD